MRNIRILSVTAGLLASAAIASAASTYQWDDGTADDAIGLGAAPWDSVWMNTFTVTGGNNQINSIEIAYSTPLDPAAGSYNGQAVEVLLYNNPGGGSPLDGVLLYSFSTTIANAGTNTFNTYAVPGVLVGSTFAVGFRYNTATLGGYPAAWDSTAPTQAGVSWAGFNEPNNTINPANLAGTIPSANFGTIESFGLAGNWLIRANATPTPGAATLLSVAGLAGLRRRRA